jgi:IS30 family transposase
VATQHEPEQERISLAVFPKDTNFMRINHHEAARVEQLINELPPKKLGYRTPSEVRASRSCCN